MYLIFILSMQLSWTSLDKLYETLGPGVGHLQNFRT